MTQKMQSTLEQLFNCGRCGFIIQHLSTAEKNVLKKLYHVLGLTFWKVQQPELGIDWIYVITEQGSIPHVPNIAHREKMYSELLEYCK